MVEKSKPVKRVATIFKEPNGTYTIGWDKGGVIPKAFQGIFTSEKAAQHAIDSYRK